ncbi:hypothetical protein KMZ15_08950 [Mycoavidus sp. HKI]|nr:hypothetical protein [Mycoavidus sp. HKI]UTU47259.1 hypothetical protein KMZ15_08950 [Mycoavidus sp. HKI]
MAIALFDTLKFCKRLKEAGFRVLKLIGLAIAQSGFLAGILKFWPASF